MTGLFRPKSVNSNAPVIASLQLQTSLIGRPIPQVYGTRRVSANVIDYDDFLPTAQTTTQGGKGGGGGGSSTSYRYKAAVIFGICQGPINAINTAVWASKDRTSLAALGLTTAVGSLGQAAPSYWATNHPTKALGYSGLAYAYSGSFDLGDSASLPTMSFNVSGFLQSTSGTGVGDADVSQIVSDLLIGDRTGAGFPSARVGSLTDMSNYTVALGIGASPAYTESAPAASMIESLCKIANTAVFYSDGQLKFVPAADAAVSGNSRTYTPPTSVQYDFTDDDFIYQKGEQPVLISRGDPADAPNSLSVTFYDAYLEYSQNRVTVTDEDAVARFGLRPAPEETLDEICDAAAASMVARLRLQRMLYQRNTYTFRVGRHYERLEPMDIVRLTESTGTPLNLVPVRVRSTKLGNDGTLEITAEDYFGTVGALPAYSYQTPGGYIADYNADPGDVSAPVIFDAPFELTESGFELWIAVAGLNALWGGCVVWMSTDGSTYKQVGEVRGPARYGALTGAVGAGSDPDTSTTVPVSLAISNGALTGGTASDADNAVTLCLMGREIFSYQTATLTGSNAYNLTTRLRRGLYRSTRTTHSSGAPFVRIDSAVVSVPYDRANIGKTVYFKFTSFNVWGSGHQDVASVPAYSYNVLGPIGGIASEKSLLDARQWVVGSSGSQGSYTYVPTAGSTPPPMSVVMAGAGGEPMGPNGRTIPLMKFDLSATGSVSIENTRDLYGIDPEKSYRFSVWVRWNTNVPDFGLFCSQGLGAFSYVSDLVAGGNVSVGKSWILTSVPPGLFVKDRWYLLVGFIQGRSSGNVMTHLTGIYDGTYGRRLLTGSGAGIGNSPTSYDDYGTDFKWQPASLTPVIPHGTHTLWVAGSGVAGRVLWAADPRFDELNANEPSITALLLPVNNDVGLNADLVPDGQFSLSVQDGDFWKGINTGGKVISPYAGEYAGYPAAVGGALEFGVGSGGAVYSIRKPDNQNTYGRKVTVTVRYRRVGTVTPASGSSTDLKYCYRAYSTPGDPAASTSGQPGSASFTTIAVVTSGTQNLTDGAWYTSTTEFTLDNVVSSTTVPYWCIELQAGNYSAGKLQIDSVNAEYTG